jgi:ketosteroid isomerase-like protein
VSESACQSDLEDNKRVVLELIANWVDPEVFDRVTAGDFQFVVEADQEFTRIAGTVTRPQALAARRAMSGRYESLMKVRTVTAEADRVAVDLVTDSRIKDENGIDRPYVNRVCFVFHLRDGKITELHEYSDTAYSVGKFPDLYGVDWTR